VVTHTPSRVDVGRKVDIPSQGIVLGGRGCGFEVNGAQQTGSRLEIQWVGRDAEAGSEWRADAVGRVTINTQIAAHRLLNSGDEIRVVDTFFRFLCGTEVQSQYHETIYHLTIRDMPTGLANARYLGEALGKDVSRALRYGKPLAVAVLSCEAGVDGTNTTSHDIVREVADKIREGAPRDWFAARDGELEVVILALGASTEQLRQSARLWLDSCGDKHFSWRLGVAELGGALQDAATLLASARVNAIQSSG